MLSVLPRFMGPRIWMSRMGLSRRVGDARFHADASKPVASSIPNAARVVPKLSVAGKAKCNWIATDPYGGSCCWVEPVAVTT